MTIDTRAKMISDQGVMLSGSLSEDHVDTTNVLAKVRGSIVFDGIKNLARGTRVNLAYQVAGYNQVTRFPKRLRVLSCKAEPLEGVTTVEVGCLLAMKQDLQVVDVYLAADHLPAWQQALPQRVSALAGTPILASGVLTYALGKLGLTQASNSEPLTSAFLVERVDLSRGYVAVINDLLMSESCYGYLNAAEEFTVRKIMQTGAAGHALRKDDMLTMESLERGGDTADEVEVQWDGSTEAAAGLKLSRVPILPALPRTAGGALMLTSGQLLKVQGKYNDWMGLTAWNKAAAQYGGWQQLPEYTVSIDGLVGSWSGGVQTLIESSEAQGILYHTIRRKGPAPAGNGVISMSDARLDQLLTEADDFYYAYRVQRQAVENVAAGRNPDGSKAS